MVYLRDVISAGASALSLQGGYLMLAFGIATLCALSLAGVSRACKLWGNNWVQINGKLATRQSSLMLRW